MAAVLHAPMTIIPGSGHLSQITHPRAVAAVIDRRCLPPVASPRWRQLVPQIEVDEAEDAARQRALPGRRGDRVRRPRAGQPRGRARSPARGGADLVGAGARRLARHLARARARVAQPARRLHGLGRAEPRARVARRDDADDRRRRARAPAATLRGAVRRAPRARALRRARAAPHRRAARRARPARPLRAGRGVRRAVRDRRSRATCSASRSTTSRACRSSTRPSRAPWSTTATPSRSAAPTPRAPS